MQQESEQKLIMDEIKARGLLNDCYIESINMFKRYIDTTEDNYKFLALWCIGTYFHSEFDTYPYLFLNAMRGSGKTRTLKLISALSNGGDGSVQNNLTEAVLFRIPQHQTTCIDEVEQINSKEKQTLRELLNSAYKKGMKVKRMRKTFAKDGEKQVAETFEPYFPIAMANIWGVEEVLADRSIVLIFEKSIDPAKVKLVEDFDKNLYIKLIKRTLDAIQCSLCSVVSKKNIIRNWNNYIYTLYTLTTQTTQTTLFDELKTYEYGLMDKGAIEKNKQLEMEELFRKIDKLDIGGRNLELMFPLLIVAQLIGEEVFNDFLKISANIVKQKKLNEYAESKDVQLYEFVLSMDSFGNDFISVKELTSRFRIFIGDGEEEDRWLNDKWLGRALKRLNLILDRRRMSSGMFVTLDYEKARKQSKIFVEDKHDKN